MSRDDAIEWLSRFLGVSIESTVSVNEAARAAGMTMSSLMVARSVLKVSSFRKAPLGPFFMCLPGVDHEPYIKLNPRCGVVEMSDKHWAISLATKWHKARKSSVAPLPGLFEQVEWVAENCLLPMSLVKVSNIPCLGALDMLLFAKDNPLVWRQMYDCKRMPNRAAVPDALSQVKAKSKVAKPKASSNAGGLKAIDRLLKRGVVSVETGVNGA